MFVFQYLLSLLAASRASAAVSATKKRWTATPYSCISFLLWYSWRFSHRLGLTLASCTCKQIYLFSITGTTYFFTPTSSLLTKRFALILHRGRSSENTGYIIASAKTLSNKKTPQLDHRCLQCSVNWDVKHSNVPPQTNPITTEQNMSQKWAVGMRSEEKDPTECS